MSLSRASLIEAEASGFDPLEHAAFTSSADTDPLDAASWFDIYRDISITVHPPRNISITVHPPRSRA